MSLSPPKMAVTTGARILLVEGEAAVARQIASSLSKTGYEVVGIAESSEDALTRTGELNPELILMDTRISGAMDEIETAVELRARFDLPVVFLGAQPIHHPSLTAAIELAIQNHRASREARLEHVQILSILDAMADAVAVFDLDRRIRYLNRPAEDLTGWGRQEALGQEIGRVLPLVDSASGAMADQVLSPSGAQERPRPLPPGLIATNRSGKSFYIEGELAPGPGGDTIVITFRDGTSRRTEETNIRQRDKMQAVGRLAAGIAHDFNNLLFIVLGYADEMLHTPGLSESSLQAMAAIRKAGESANAITEQLLKFSRKDSAPKKEINLNRIINEMEDSFRQPGGQPVQLELRLDQDLGSVHADEGELKLVLMNLTANARAALPAEGGKITIETWNEERLGRSPSVADKESFVVLRFSDNGAGMSPETAGHLFEPFYTTKRRAKGTGLGLTIVHGIVTDLGGTIMVESEPGRGAAFTLCFPRAALGADASGEPPSATILLADDQDGVRKLLRTYLETSGFHVLEAEDGEAAIRIANEYPGSIDLLITDVVMPKVDGFEVVRALSGRTGLKVMFISAHAQDFAHGVESLPAGARFLPKPFKKTEFMKNVIDLLGVEPARTMKSGV